MIKRIFWILILLEDIAYFLLLFFGDMSFEKEWYCIFGALIFLICAVLYFISERKKTKIYGRVIIALISLFVYTPLINDDMSKLGIGLISYTPATSLDGFFIIVTLMVLWTVYLLLMAIMNIIKYRKKTDSV